MPNASVGLPGLRVFFYSNEHEPRHVHVTDGASEVVFAFESPEGPLILRENHGFAKRRINRIQKDLVPYVAVLWADWQEHFGND